MRVLIDAHMIGSGETGNETYIANLVPALAKLPTVHCGAAMTRNARIPTGWQDQTIQKLPLWSANNWLRLTYSLPSLCHRWQADLLHVTFAAPFLIPCPLVVSVHDVSFKRYPEFFSARDRLLFATLLPLSLRRAQAVLTLSNHARVEILATYPFLRGKVYTVRLAAGRQFRPVIDFPRLKAVRDRYDLQGSLVLAVGNLQPRKNLERLVQAMAIVCDQHPETNLVLVGQAQLKVPALVETIRQCGLEGRVYFTGYVSTDDLVALYSLSTLFVYPSIYEGFGLPVLEAMACGTPVITTNTSAMPDIAGEAALLVDPYDVQAIARAINRVLAEKELQDLLCEKGLARARQFSWNSTALETLALYEQLT